MSKFERVPSPDPETRVLSRGEKRFGEFDAAVEIWFWDGYYGRSVIFVTEEVKALSEADLKELVREQLNLPADEELNVVSQGREYTFVNFALDEDQD